MESKTRKEEENLLNKIVSFLLSISKKKYGIDEEGGILLMSKIICIQALWEQAIGYFQRLDITDTKLMTNEQSEKWIKELENVLYFINRDYKYFDDMETQTIIIGELNDKSHEQCFNVNDIKSITAYDFSYLNSWKF